MSAAIGSPRTGVKREKEGRVNNGRCGSKRAKTREEERLVTRQSRSPARSLRQGTV